MKLRATSGTIMAGALLLCEIAAGQNSVPAANGNFQRTGQQAPPVEEIIRQVRQTELNRRLPSVYQLIRQYRLTGAAGKSVQANALADLDFAPGNDSYAIQEQKGSARATEVVRRVVEHEVQASADAKAQSDAALTPQNYDFHYSGEASVDGHDCYVLGLTPKRRQADLISGQVAIDERTHQVRRMEGDLAKSPSLWIRKVHVVLSFGEINGSWLQTNLTAVADVRFVGQETLNSQLVDFRIPEVLAQKAPTVTHAPPRHGKARPAIIVAPRLP